MTPWKYVGGVRVCFDPLKMSHIISFIQICCCITARFTTSRMDSWTLSLHWSCLCWRCYHPYVWTASKIVSSNQCLCCSTGPELSWPKTKLQNVGAGDPSLIVLIDHCTHAVLHTIDRLQLGWPKTKLQNMGTGDPPSKILIEGVVEGVEEFIYLGSKQSSNGYCRPYVLRRIGLACSVMNSLQRVWNCSSLSISTKVYL